LRGVVDSEDLPLNVSREMLQNNPLLALIRAGVTSRVIAELEKKAKDSPDDYAKFWENFGQVLKEGLYEDRAHRDALLGLARFRSTVSDSLTSLVDYVGRMKEGQDAIFYIAGEDVKTLATSPQLEGFKRKGVEVLFMPDAVDEFWIGGVGKYLDKPLRSITRGSADLGKIKSAEAEEKKPEDSANASGLVAFFRLTLHDHVKDVRESQRLTDSAVCLVADEHDLDIHLERLLRAHRQLDTTSKRILEINAAHPLMRRLADNLAQNGADEAVRARLADIAHLLLDQARIVEGERPADPNDFARRLANVLAA
jgi:molecular chaperone HtpG